MATEISIPTLTGSTNYELWKLETQVWTFVIDLSKEKQAEAVALSFPSKLLAFKLLRTANSSKQKRIIVLTGVNFGDLENMYKQTLTFFNKIYGRFNRGRS